MLPNSNTIKKRPNILSIAGFDPTGGAGILADIKTFEQNKCIGMAVQTANTIQTDTEFKSVNWVDEKLVIDQLEMLLNKFTFTAIKIGLIPNLSLLNTLIGSITNSSSKIKIIWDPVLSASAGFDFNQDFRGLETTLEKLYLITPNYNEVCLLSNNDDHIEAAIELSKYCKVLLKGGHQPTNVGVDIVYESGKIQQFNPKTINFTPKHGTGCVFSSAIAANLAKDYSLQKSILRSKRYIEHFIESNRTLIGSHK